MPPPSLRERNRMKAFVAVPGEGASSSVPASPQQPKRRHEGGGGGGGDQSPDMLLTGTLDVVDKKTRPASVQGGAADDRRAARLDYLLDGSELSEGFMRSGRSTPTSDFADRVPFKYVLPSGGGSKPQTQTQTQLQHFKKPPRPVVADAVGKHVPALAVGDDFRMTVVSAPRQTSVAADLKDGFSAAPITHHARNPPPPPSPVRRDYHHHHHQQHQHRRSQHHPPKHQHAQLAIREARASASQPGEEVVRGGRAEARRRYGALSPTFDDTDDGSSSAVPANAAPAEDDITSTPRRAPAPPPPRSNRVHYALSPVKKPSAERKRQRHPSLDYDDNVLSTMEFRHLQDQPFDFDPAVAVSHHHHLHVPSGSNPGAAGAAEGQQAHHQQLAQVQLMGGAEQHRYFASMSVSEWEATGDWFVEQFASIMQRLTAARRSKRLVVEEFEQEAAVREAEVRRRSDKIDEKLHKMRQDGLKVVGGKDS